MTRRATLLADKQGWNAYFLNEDGFMGDVSTTELAAMFLLLAKSIPPEEIAKLLPRHHGIVNYYVRALSKTVAAQFNIDTGQWP